MEGIKVLRYQLQVDRQVSTLGLAHESKVQWPGDRCEPGREMEGTRGPIPHMHVNPFGKVYISRCDARSTLRDLPIHADIGEANGYWYAFLQFRVERTATSTPERGAEAHEAQMKLQKERARAARNAKNTHRNPL